MAENAGALLPCPFCGDTAALCGKSRPEGGWDRWVGCYNDECAVTPETHRYREEASAIAAWNKRLAPTPEAP